jgi:hypothetical protein
MHGLAFLAVELVIGAALILAVTVIVLARIHAARMKKLDARYSPLPEFELDNYYAQSKPLHAADTGESSIGWEKEKYAHLSRAAGL